MKKQTKLLISLTIFIISCLISIPFSIMDFNYKLDKCDNLKQTESSYDFTNTIEVNANYNSNCYFLNNHPLAFWNNLFLGFLWSIFLGMGLYLALTVFCRYEDDY